MARSPDRYEIIRNHNNFLSLKRHWDDLYERSAEHDLTQSFEWCRNSWEIVAKPQGHRLHCLVAWRGERPMLIWPVLTYRRGLRRLAHPLGPETSELQRRSGGRRSRNGSESLFGMAHVA